MMRAFPLIVLLLVIGAGCSHRVDLTRPSTQDNVGVQMAQMNLWREAMFRFQRAVQLEPNDAMAHNNLAVAFEANGDFDAAAKEYREALRLDRANQYIQKNYSRYTEFMSRNRKRQQRRPTAPSTAAESTSSTEAAPGVTPPTAAGSGAAPAPAPPVDATPGTTGTPPTGPAPTPPTPVPTAVPTPPDAAPPQPPVRPPGATP